METPLNEPQSSNSVTVDSVARFLNPKTLDGLIADSIDHVLSDVLGRKAKEAIYDYIERNYSVAREDIPKNIEPFLTLMEEVFGRGSKTIARCIMKRVWQRLGWEFTDIPGFEFLDYLDAARARIAREVVQKAKAVSLKG